MIESLRVAGDAKSYGRPPQCIVLVPTRELAKQVAAEFEMLAPDFGVLSVYGGSAYGPQLSTLNRGVDIVIGTPGRVIDMIDKKALDLSNIKTLIMDEADYMLDMGFAPDMERVLSSITSDSHQTLLFSATMPFWVRKVSQKFLKEDQVMIDLVGTDTHKVAPTVTHYAIPCTRAQKQAMIFDIVKRYAPEGKAIMFTERKATADTLYSGLAGKLKVAVLHGDIAQSTRESTILGFKAGRYDLLIATDVASR